jgi:hypothetical protein
MPTRRPKTPKEVLKVHRQQEVQEGDEVIIRAKVTRIGKDTDDNPNKVTVQLKGFGVPVTLSPEFVEAPAED